MLRATCTVRRAGIRRDDGRRAGVLRAAVGMAVLAGTAALASCSDPPSSPGPVVTPPPVQTPNNPPVIDSVTVSESRVEAGQEITVTATVRDAETAIDQLVFAWKADAGTFSGAGPSVRWRAPKGAASPAAYTLQLTVTENYGSQTSGGVPAQHVINGTSPQIRVHDSVVEIGDIALRFLRMFADSRVPAATAVQEFSDSCPGKAHEKEDVEDNRRDFEILSSQLNLSSARVRMPWADGEATVRCAFTSRRKYCGSGAPAGCRVGAVESVAGDCNLTTVYEQQRWLLCNSTFRGTLLPVMRSFFGRDR